MTEGELIDLTARQLASGLIRAICAAQGVSSEDAKTAFRIPWHKMHFHDASQAEIAWNDVQAIKSYNEVTGENIPVPLVATEGYNRHYHRSETDGGYIAGMGPHDHRDNFNGGICFAAFHPGTALPQMPFSV
jgi:glyoxylate utilization-related uncharacterized protein